MQNKDLYPKILFTNLPFLESTEDLPLEELNVFLKFSTPLNPDWSWYVFSGDVCEDGDIEFYGYVVNDQCEELGYFMLSDLASVFAVPDHSFNGTVMDIHQGTVCDKEAG